MAIYLYVRVCVCVCVRERGRERGSGYVFVCVHVFMHYPCERTCTCYIINFIIINPRQGRNFWVTGVLLVELNGINGFLISTLFI